MNNKELRKLSLEFRRLSSNLLNSNHDNADVNLARFVSFINDSEFIHDVINQKITHIDFNFKECFSFEQSGWADFNIPADEACHIKAQYDYMTFINDSDAMCVRSQAIRYPWSDRDINNIIQKFIFKAFKSFIDFINDQISLEMINMDEERKTISGSTFIQNIETVNGSANQQANGIINNYTTNNNVADIITLIDKIISSLSYVSETTDEVDNVKDDLEVIQEQLKSNSPKKSRLNKAISGVKKFMQDFPMKLAVSWATNIVTNTDWESLIQQLETFMQNTFA